MVDNTICLVGRKAKEFLRDPSIREKILNEAEEEDATISLYLSEEDEIKTSDLDIFNDPVIKKIISSIDLPGCKNITDASSLKGIPYLNLEGTSITDASMFGNARHLDISETNVEYVSELGNVNCLLLNDCPKITNLEGLGNNKILYLKNGIFTDVSMLGNVELLNLTGCLNVEDVSHLGNVKKILF